MVHMTAHGWVRRVLTVVALTAAALALPIGGASAPRASAVDLVKGGPTFGVPRVVDPVQLKRRTDDFDFDIAIQRFSFSSTPGDSLRTYFTSQSAAVKGSQNVAGIADPVLDLDVFFGRLKGRGLRLGLATMDSEEAARAAMLRAVPG